MPALDPPRRPHDGSRTRAEARVAFPTLDHEDEIAIPTRAFSLREITAGLPDDSRAEDERAEARRLRDLRGRVERARAVVAATAGFAEVLARDWPRAAMFYARYGITQQMPVHGVGAGDRHLAVPTAQGVA